MNRLFQDIPEDWQLSKIGNYTTNVEYGLSKAMNSEKLGVPILRMNNLDGEGFLDISDLKYVDISKDQINKYKLNEDDILFNRVNSVELVGKTSIVKENIENLVFASYLIRVNVDSEQLLPDYLNYYLNSQLGTKEINRNLRRASSQANINAQELRSMKIIVPPIKEQKKIISIIFNIDSIIQTTQSSIEKLQECKKGLMQKLLRQGFGHNEFKDTKLGLIPMEWDIIRLSKYISLETGKRNKGGALNEGNVASIGGEHVNPNGRINWEKMKFITPELYDKMTTGKIHKDDILIVKDGATTGKAAFIEYIEYEKCAINEHVFIIRTINPDFIHQKFLFYILDSDIGQRQIKSQFHGLIGGIKRSDVKTLIIPRPKIEEQRKIALIFDNLDKNIFKNIDYKDQLKLIKKGLMQVLLTGRKRVHIKNNIKAKIND